MLSASNICTHTHTYTCTWFAHLRCLLRRMPSASRYYGHVTCKAKIAARYLLREVSRGSYARKRASVHQRAYQRPERQWPVKFRPEERINPAVYAGESSRNFLIAVGSFGRRSRAGDVQSGALIGKKEETPSHGVQNRRGKGGMRSGEGNSLDDGSLEATMEPAPRFFSKRPGLRSTYFSLHRWNL